MKLTKKHYNRKVLSFGILIFVAISLISTGFAAWIISTGSTNETPGNVSIGTIEESNLTFENVAITGDVKNFMFEPLKSDDSGEIKWDDEQDDVFENLSLTITGSISPAEYLDDLTIQLELPESVKAAATAGYITLPTCTVAQYLVQDGQVATLTAGVKDNQGSVVKNEDVITFSYTISFGWGSEFENQNPGISLDADDALTAEMKKAKMIAFKRVFYGFSAVDSDPNYKSDADVMVYQPTTEQQLKFNIKLVATTN